MIRTQIQLEEKQYHTLKEMAAEYKVSVATLVRQGVDMLIEKKEKPSREELGQRVLDFIKKIEENPDKFKDIEGKTDVSTNHDEYFAQAAES